MDNKENTGIEVAAAMDELSALLNKTYSPEYYAMQDKYRAELMEIAENAHPAEYSYGIDFLATFIKWMRDYYKNGEAVIGMEDKEWKKGVKYTRLETLEQALYYYDKWQNVEEDYVKVVQHGEFKSHDNGDGTSTIDDLGYHCIYKYGTMKRTYKKLHKVQEKYKKLFFKTVAKYLESWWD